MAYLQLECPKCGETLELDEAFAEGVCRCSACGVLLAVTGSPKPGQAEAQVLQRPERPAPAASANKRATRSAAPPSDTLGASPFPSPQVLPRARSDRPHRHSASPAERQNSATRITRHTRPPIRKRRDSFMNRYWLPLALLLAIVLLGAIAAAIFWLG